MNGKLSLRRPLTKMDYLLTGLVISSVIYLYYPVIVKMVKQWYQDPNYSHGFIVPIISLYMLWQRREKLRTTPVNPSNKGLIVLASGVFLLLAGTVMAELFTMRTSFIVILAGLVIYLFGVEVFRVVSLPLFYLFFMIPIPYILYDAVAFPLQLFAAKASVNVLQALNIPVYREGNVIHLIETTLAVEEACSGIRSLMSLIALSIPLVYFTGSGLLRGVIIVLSAIPIAIFVNLMRIVLTGVLAHHYGAKAAMGFFHEFSGMIMFGVAMVILLTVTYVVVKVPSFGRK